LLTPLRERLKAVVDGIQRLEVEGGKGEQLAVAKSTAGASYDAFMKEGTGLFALRTDVLAGKKAQEAAYAAQRRAILQPIDEATGKLNVLVDSPEVQMVKQRQSLEAALRLRNEPGGVVAASDAIALDMKEMTANIRLLMRATTADEAKAAESAIEALGGRVRDRGTRRPHGWPHRTAARRPAEDGPATAGGQRRRRRRGAAHGAPVGDQGRRRQAQHDRVDQQASRLQETVASMAQLIATLRANTEAAQRADPLAGTARAVPASGGEVVGQGVQAIPRASHEQTASLDQVSEAEGLMRSIAASKLDGSIAAPAGEVALEPS
jgi:hypothetical protein